MEEKKCPFCAEIIKSEAIVCKHCGRDLFTDNPSLDNIYLQDENVLVSITRYKVSNTVYAMKDITSVTLSEEISSRTIPIILWLIAIIHLIWGIELISEILFDIRIIDTLAIFGLGIVINFFYADYYYVTITNNSQQINTFKSSNKQYVASIIEAINQAIIQRG